MKIYGLWDYLSARADKDVDTLLQIKGQFEFLEAYSEIFLEIAREDIKVQKGLSAGAQLDALKRSLTGLEKIAKLKYKMKLETLFDKAYELWDKEYEEYKIIKEKANEIQRG